MPGRDDLGRVTANKGRRPGEVAAEKANQQFLSEIFRIGAYLEKTVRNGVTSVARQNVAKAVNHRDHRGTEVTVSQSDPSDEEGSRPVPLSLGSRRQVAARRSLAICTQQD